MDQIIKVGSGRFLEDTQMGMKNLLFGFFLHLLIAFSNSQQCFYEEKTCELDASNILEIFENISDLVECRQLCQETRGCKYFIHQTNEDVPSHNNKCYTLRSCNSMVDFPGSTIGTTDYCTCSLGVQPTDGVLVGERFTETELECQFICKNDEECTIYSYHQQTSDCQLFSSAAGFEEAALPEFFTGPGECASQDGICSFSLLNANTHHLVYLDSIDMLVRSGMLDCDVSVEMVLIGDGGGCDEANYGHCYGNAGGSGFVNKTLVTLRANTILHVELDYRKKMQVTNDQGDILCSTRIGEDGTNKKGGDGYSGGGFGEDSDGGHNGSDADCEGESCGKGQGINIKQYSTTHFNLKAGPAQQAGYYSPGGGGGVKVNGHGADGWDGRSYGEGLGFAMEIPIPGCVLLDILV